MQIKISEVVTLKAEHSSPYQTILHFRNYAQSLVYRDSMCFPYHLSCLNDTLHIHFVQHHTVSYITRLHKCYTLTAQSATWILQ